MTLIDLVNLAVADDGKVALLSFKNECAKVDLDRDIRAASKDPQVWISVTLSEAIDPFLIEGFQHRKRWDLGDLVVDTYMKLNHRGG